jgi:succinate-semialdehyde dehydrogenase / glutarate-semialdehyde dehydrogenase
MPLQARLYIDGHWLDDAGGGQRPLIDPATEQVVGSVPLADAAHVDAAAASAARGFEVWRRISALERSRVLARAAALMRERAPRMAADLCTEQGKPLAEALREVTLSADIVAFQAEEARRLYGRTVPPRVDGVLSHAVLREPVGPVAAFTAWNFPVNLPARKLGAALAAGCSVVLKPAEETPTSAMHLVQCLLDAGLPPQAVQLVCGDPAMVSSRLIAHRDIAKVSLTGSVAVGRLLAEQCARHDKRFAGELGGHAPVIVCGDADAGRGAEAGGAGQVPQRRPGLRFADPLHRRAPALRAFRRRPGARRGAPCAWARAMTPPRRWGRWRTRRLHEMQQCVDDARDQGAAHRLRRAARTARRLVLRAHRDHRRPGHQPRDARRTLRPHRPGAALRHAGRGDRPGQPARPRDALRARRLRLHARPVTAHRLGAELDAGMVGLNHFGVSQPELPFGGRGASGDGVEMGAEGLLAYTEMKTITVGAL